MSSFDGEDKRVLFDDGWKCFEPLTHAEGNVERLRRCRMEPPKSKGHFVY